MRVYRNINVMQAAQQRIAFLFDNFKNIVVGLSGGKDSTVVMNLALAEARKRNRLPLPVLFIDQEAEWEGTIDYVRECMDHPDVKPIWLQVPFKITNASSAENDCLHAWEENKRDLWMREKEPDSYHQNIFGTEKYSHLNEFYALFPAVLKHLYGSEPAAYIAGVRTEESPSRYVGLTNRAVFKWITWGKVLDKKHQHITFYPIYDWSYTDVWKAIHENGWPYCRIYDQLYAYGVSPIKMRISNLHHETAVASLFHLQEIEKNTYNRLCARLNGVDAAGKLGQDDFFVKDLPFMFGSWIEYRDFLLEKLIPEEHKPAFVKKFAAMDNLYKDMNGLEQLHKIQVHSLCINDFGFVKLNNFERQPEAWAYRKSLQGREFEVRNNSYGKFIKKKPEKEVIDDGI